MSFLRRQESSISITKQIWGLMDPCLRRGDILPPQSRRVCCAYRYFVVGTAYPTFLCLRFGILALVFLALAAGGQGCSEPIATAPEPLLVQAEADQLWQFCQTELKTRGFQLDRVDRRSGVIETYPLTSKQWFEFWCQDVVTAHDLAESSLHTIRRRVSMAVSAAPEDRYRLQCRVAVERLSAPPELTSGQVRVRDIFAQSAGRIPTPQVSEKRKKYPPQWLPIGQDHALENDILQAIHRNLNREPQG